MYTFCIVVILLASVSLIFVVLVQSPKGGMAANFGAANQVMGVRDAANGLEKFTWAMALVIVVLSLVATLSMDKGTVAASNKDLEKDANARPLLPSSLPRISSSNVQATLRMKSRNGKSGFFCGCGRYPDK